MNPSMADSDGRTPFFIAYQNGNFKIVKLRLQDERVDPNKTNNVGQTAFFAACRNGGIEVVKLMLTDSRIAPPPRHTLEEATAEAVGNTNAITAGSTN
jgi:ankyrin repeat protein